LSVTVLPPLPIDEVLSELGAVLTHGNNALVVAEPAAGKTTRVPMWLLGQSWLGSRKIVMLEPRRLAARAAARHMALALAEAPGGTVGYRVRFDERVSARTRVEIVTEGILVRRLQSDPAIADVGLLIFDEFHERSLDADLGLALALEVQDALRRDLRILVMSATLPAARLAILLGNAPIIRASGRTYPVTTHHLGRSTRQTVAQDVADAVVRALGRHPGSLLAFLPGESEIRRAERLLHETQLPSDICVLPLYGSLSGEQQDRALAPASEGLRKVVLATTIAETSLTIDGIGIVIDSGFKRVPQFDPATGMTQLATVRVSAASAEQRRGRAGRQGPGICYRLWPEPEMHSLASHDVPEIAQADLASFALNAAQWGTPNAADLKLLDQPPPGALAQARDLLRALEAVTADGNITGHGRAMAALPLHPRLAHMVVRGAERGWGTTATDIAALLSERDILRGSRDASLSSRLEALRGSLPADGSVDQATVRRIKAAARQITGISGIAGDATPGNAAALLALAYPDRVAKARNRRGQFLLASGSGAILEETDPLAAEPYLAVATTDGNPANARIFLAAPIDETTIRELFSGRIESRQSVHWDKRREAVIAHERERLGELVLAERPLADPDPELAVNALIGGLHAMGIDALPWSKAARSLQQRVIAMGRAFPEERWPDWSDVTLLDSLDTWLRPHIGGLTRRREVGTLNLAAILEASLPPDRMRRLDRLLPASLTVPSGSRIAIDYSGAEPVLRVKLQEMFGLETAPVLAAGRVPLKIELLSPAGRPLAITSDLARFWANAYPKIRSEMRGRYARHPWPEDPLAATPTRKAKPR
jgi:ATP-dependent helicase HrpB